jgi:hypothetical protein
LANFFDQISEFHRVPRWEPRPSGRGKMLMPALL